MSNPDDLGLPALSNWLSDNLSGFRGPVKAHKFSGGQSNPTFRLTTPDTSYVLRRKPLGTLLKSAHAIEREFRVQEALKPTKVPVADMHVLCEDADVIGSAFYIMSEVRGRIFDDPRLPGLSPGGRSRLIDQMNRVLATIHGVDIDAAGLSDYGPGGNYFHRQVDRWAQQYKATQTDTLPDMVALIDRLQLNIPPDDGQRGLVHGDYRLDNLVFDSNSNTCVAVLDWELSTIGHPYADLASVIMQWQMPAGSQGRGLDGVNRSELGLWSDRRFIETYCQRRGLPEIENFGFYLAFCHFRMGAILQGVKKRALDGTASDPDRAMKLGAYVPEFARKGLKALKEVI